MKKCRNQFFTAICTLGTILTPQIVYSIPLFESTGFMAGEWAKISVGIRAPGIGGLQLDSTSELSLAPQSLSYSNGYLNATVQEKQLKVKVNPLVVIDSMFVIENTNKRKFDVSIDVTHSSSVPYIDNEIQSNLIGLSLLNADLGFASLVQGGQQLPEGGGLHPYDEAIKLLELDNEYRQLTQTWTSPPLSYPQIFLKFEPEISGMVDMEFRPQVFFRSPHGHPIEVSDNLEQLGKRPYENLIKDIKLRPNIYRQTLPTLDRAASITATMGLLNAGCNRPVTVNCSHIIEQALVESNLGQVENKEQLLSQYISKRKELLVKELESNLQREENQEISSNLKSLEANWDKLRFQDFQPGDNPKAWGTAYDALQEVINFSSANTRSKIQKIDIIQQQFLSYTAPNDSLLKAASAFAILSDSRNLAKAKEQLNLAVEFSTEYPGTRIEVANIGVSFGLFTISLGNQMIEYGTNSQDNSLVAQGNSFIQEGKQVINNMNQKLIEAQVKAYNEIDRYLANCMETISNCSSKDLRTWEANITRINFMFRQAKAKICSQDTECYQNLNSRNKGEILNSLIYNDIPENYVDWLHGRFAYLIGVQEPKWRADRLRFLSYYEYKLKNTEYGQELTKLKKNLINMN